MVKRNITAKTDLEEYIKKSIKKYNPELKMISRQLRLVNMRQKGFNVAFLDKKGFIKKHVDKKGVIRQGKVVGEKYHWILTTSGKKSLDELRSYGF